MSVVGVCCITPPIKYNDKISEEFNYVFRRTELWGCGVTRTGPQPVPTTARDGAVVSQQKDLPRHWPPYGWGSSLRFGKDLGDAAEVFNLDR